MTWHYSNDAQRKERRQPLDAALRPEYESPAGMPARGNARTGGGSRSGAPIWAMREAYMPSPCTCWPEGRSGQPRSQTDCRRHSGAAFGGDGEADPDGFAVFGRFPKGWLDHVLKLRLLGKIARDDILHVCSGTLSESERWTVDIRRQARPMVVAAGRALPFRDASFRAVLLDPPYSDAYARNLYGVENPRPSHLLREAARVVMPCGRIGMLQVAIPFSPPGCRLINVWGVSTGTGFRIRAFTVWERQQENLL